jgi:uracil-DNA glycosylase family 4
MSVELWGAEPPRDCPLCPRLVAYRLANRDQNPDWWNGPAPSFGDPEARLLVAGLAPGRTGANRTGRPFTGDGAGWMLYETLLKTGFASGSYEARPDDTLKLHDCMITNAVRCAPPGNKPLPEERDACVGYLARELELLTTARVIVCLGSFAYEGVAGLVGLKPRPRFGHGVEVPLPDGRTILCSFHPSQQNTFTGRLTEPMLDAVFTRAVALTGPF